MHPLLRFVNSVCVQPVVYWGSPVPDGYGGSSYAPPVDAFCRWEDKMQLVTANNGEEIVSQAQVLVTQAMVINGLLWLGAVADLTPTELLAPATIVGCNRILRVDQVPLFRSATEFIWTVYL